jgi:hypothetical protein
LIGVAETYDVLVKIPDDGAYELRATAHDGSGYASVWLGNGHRFPAPDVPKPNLYQGMAHGGHGSFWALTPADAMGMPDHAVDAGRFDQPGMAGMTGMSMEKGQPMDHDKHMMPNQSDMQHGGNSMHGDDRPVAGDMTKHHDMVPKLEAVQTAHMQDKTYNESRKGKKYAKNFQLFASDVAPMSTTVIEFAANEFGDWFFHCHLLYHMKSGMARFIHYDGYQPDPEVVAVQPTLFKESWHAWGDADVLSNMTEGTLTLSDTRNIFQGSWEAGWQDVDETDWEGLFTYDRYMNRFASIFVGVDLLGEGSSTEETRGVFGLRYLLPLNIESSAWIDTDAGARIMVDKEFTLTPRLSLVGEVEYDTHDLWEGKVGLAYVLTKTASLLAQWHSEFGWGGGL